MSVPMLVKGLVNRFKPAVANDNTYANLRLDRYGQIYDNPIYDSVSGAAEDGSLWLATNPTMGTAIAVTTSITAYAETAGAVGFGLVVKNTSSAGDTAKRIVMSRITLPIVQVPTSATSWQYVLVLTNNPAFYTSGGSVLAPVNVNSDIISGSVAQVFFGALTTAVPGTDKRYVGRGTLRGIIPTTFDEMSIVFRGCPTSALATAGSMRNVCYNEPVVIGPGYSLGLSMFGASNGAAPTFEPTISWIER